VTLRYNKPDENESCLYLDHNHWKAKEARVSEMSQESAFQQAIYMMKWQSLPKIIIHAQEFAYS
jgi:hypothetical protein